MASAEERRRSSNVVRPDALHVTSVMTKGRELAIVVEDGTLDDQALGALGYKQEFKRDFTLFESFSVSFS
ncbi:hypothetical protein B0A51_17260, partial [Rachicladosporium sp. CCFEE 5018]